MVRIINLTKYLAQMAFGLYIIAGNRLTLRLSATLSAALNAQMTKEGHASQIYLSYAAWASSQGYDGIANFLFRHAEEERNHMMKFLQYILERGAEVNVDGIPDPGPKPTSVQNCFEKVFEQEY